MLWVLVINDKGTLMSTHNIGFYEELKKSRFPLSSNTHLIYSSVTYLVNGIAGQDEEIEVGWKMTLCLLYVMR